MAKILEIAISILTGNLNSSLSYLITTVLVWPILFFVIVIQSCLTFYDINQIYGPNQTQDITAGPAEFKCITCAKPRA